MTESIPSLASSLQTLTEEFTSHFPEQRTGARLIGREAEYPVVTAEGDAADVRSILEAISKIGGFEEIREPSGLLVELVGKDYRYSLEVGWGTIELISRPCQTLGELEELHKIAVARLLSVTKERGLEVLGYGIQPKTPGSDELMSPKDRYSLLHDVIGDTWLSFTTTASDQIHVDISREELVPTLNLGNMLHPVVLALFANSPIAAGKDTGFASARDGLMGQIHSATCRHGMTAKALVTIDDWIDLTAQHTFLVRKENGVYHPENTQSFIDYVRKHGPQFEDFLMHDHYIWNSARARTAHGTIELRAACQQPWSAHMSVAAFSLGLIEATSTLTPWLTQELGAEAWQKMRAYGDDVLKQGLSAKEPFSGMLHGILTHCKEALKARNNGEETYIVPLFERLASRQNPASKRLASFTGDIAALVSQTKIELS